MQSLDPTAKQSRHPSYGGDIFHRKASVFDFLGSAAACHHAIMVQLVTKERQEKVVKGDEDGSAKNSQTGNYRTPFFSSPLARSAKNRAALVRKGENIVKFESSYPESPPCYKH